MDRGIYLDACATTPLGPEVHEAMAACRSVAWANPSSQHSAGRRARQLIEDARESIGQLLGACQSGHDADTVLFTSGATEANNLALFGLMQPGFAPLALKGDSPHALLVSPIEHPSVLEPAAELARRGLPVTQLQVCPQGSVNPQQLEEFAPHTASVIALQWGNHETGAIQDIAAVARWTSEHGAALHCDAVQAVGKVPVNFIASGATTMTVSGHKLHGPRGIGVLLIRGGTTLKPFQFGGVQQTGLRPGTEPVELAVGLATALKTAVTHQAEHQQHLEALRNRFEAAILDAIPSAVVQSTGVQSADVARLPHIACIAFPGIDRQQLAMALDLAGVYCSTGTACASGSSEPSPVLLALGRPKEQIDGALRFSFSVQNIPAEVELAIERILPVVKRLQSGKT